MKRNEWEFPYDSKVIMAAAAKKVEYHEGRLAFWEGKKVDTIRAIETGGIEVSESLGGSTYSNTGRGAQIVVKANLQIDLNECTSKMEEHRSKIANYQTYVDALTIAPDTSLQLTVEDIQFFYGK